METKKSKIYFLFLLILISLIIFLIIKGNKISQNVKTYLKFLNIKETIENLDNIDVLNKETLIKNDKYLYNVKYLPKSYLLDLDLKKYKINDIENNLINKSFYLDTFENNIILVTNEGEFYFQSSEKILNNKKKKKFIKINSDLDTGNLNRILDIYINSEKIFISLIKKINKCQIFTIYFGKFDFNNIAFKKFFQSDECGEYVQAGRMKEYMLNDRVGLLVTTHNDVPDDPSNRPQDDSSIFGKILHIDYLSKEISIISKGHRNSQGLYVDKNLILITEHGPQGGDEINKILVGGNYGWPVASYGKPYNDDQKDLYKKNHKALNFIEPIFSFVKSIAISEIVKIPKNFYSIDNLTNIFYVSSLNGRSLYLVRFDEEYNRIIFIEKIFIGERIRDIIYIKEFNTFLLSLEETFSIGTIKVVK